MEMTPLSISRAFHTFLSVIFIYFVPSLGDGTALVQRKRTRSL